MGPPEPLHFGHLEKVSGLVHGVFPRTGGVSLPPRKGLNIGLGCGDNPDHVRENRRLMLETLGLSRAVFLSQVHGDRIHVIRNTRVNPDKLWDPETGLARRPVEADAVITDTPGLGLVIQVADCQAVILYDPVNRVTANVHSGWRGSAADILGKTVDRMKAEFGCCPAHILAGICPSLGPCCGEFVNYREELPRKLWTYRQKDRPLFDFWAISRDQLKARGLKENHIRCMGLCTVCRTDLFFSFRREKNTGRFAAVTALING